MTPSAVHRKGAKIVRVGFSFKLCSPDKAVSFEVSPKRDHIETFTNGTTATTSMLADYAPGTIKFGSVGCSHLNQFLAACNALATTEEEKLTESGSQTIAVDRHMPRARI